MLKDHNAVYAHEMQNLYFVSNEYEMNCNRSFSELHIYLAMIHSY